MIEEGIRAPATKTTCSQNWGGAFPVRSLNMSYAGPQALLSLAWLTVLVRHGDKVGRTKASEFLFSTGKPRQNPIVVRFLVHGNVVYDNESCLMRSTSIRAMYPKYGRTIAE